MPSLLRRAASSVSQIEGDDEAEATETHWRGVTSVGKLSVQSWTAEHNSDEPGNPKPQKLIMEVKKDIANLRLLLYTDVDQLIQQHSHGIQQQLAKSHQQVVQVLCECLKLQEKVITQLSGQSGVQRTAVAAPVTIAEESHTEVQVVQAVEEERPKGFLKPSDSALSLEPSPRSPPQFVPVGIGSKKRDEGTDAGQEQGPTSHLDQFVDGVKKASSVHKLSRNASVSALEEARKMRAQKVSAIRKSHGSEFSEHLDEPQTLRERVGDIVASVQFEIFISALVITNLLFVAVQVQYSVDNPDKPTDVGIQVVEYLYMSAFTLELVARLFVEGCAFFYGSQWPWNWIDFIIVLFSFMELCGNLMGSSSRSRGNMTYLRIVRVARTIRVIRVVRIMRFFRALRILVYSIMCTLKSLFWTMLLLILIIYVFGIVFTSSAGEYLAVLEPVDYSENDRVLKNLFGSIPRSLFTLFKGVTNGQDWDDIVTPLSDIHWVLVMLFVLYISFTYFAVLNVVTGVFCQSAIESAQLDQDMVVQAQIAQKEMLITKLKKLFYDIDRQHLGTLTLSEFEERLKDDQVEAYFATLELEVSDAWTLFKLLDADETHVVSIDDFVMGCLRLKGQAKSIDIAKMMYENKWMMRKLETFMRNYDEKSSLGILPMQPSLLPISKDLRSNGVAQAPTPSDAKRHGDAPQRQVAWSSHRSDPSEDSWGEPAVLPGQVGELVRSNSKTRPESVS